MGLKQEARERLIELVAEDPTLWRAEAWAAYGQVADELSRVRATKALPRADPIEASAFDREMEIVRDALDDALEAMAPRRGEEEGSKKGSVLSRLSITVQRYYSGADINRTWSAIHRASEALYSVYNSSELEAQATRLKALVAALPDLQTQLAALSDVHAKWRENEDDEARRKIRWRKAPAGRARKANARESGPERQTDNSRHRARALFRELYRQAIATTESLQAEARILRNTLLVASCALFTIIVLVGVVSLFEPDLFSLCGKAPKSGDAVCPTGNTPQSFDVFAVALAGMFGGMLSVVIPLATGERIKTPYRVFNHQLLLKILAGAATALAGMLLINSGLVTAIYVKDGAMIFGYAIVFGFSQQIVTGFIDRRANDLGKETPTTKSV